MNLNLNLMSQVESLLFLAGDEGLSLKQLSQYTEVSQAVLQHHIEILQQNLKDDDSRGIELKILAGKFQFVTKAANAEVIAKMVEQAQLNGLSQAALEVLAIIAYNQPITRIEIDEIRGVKSDSAIQTLVGRVMIKEVGRAEGIGRAILYGTTSEFLQLFGLKDLQQLPPLPAVHQDEESDTDLFLSKFQEQFEGEPV